ncbi:hypothetical protein ACN08Z_03320 [Rothia sp. P7181]|uniref:hypothetical protein n=1 Tax=unclassified Rothia (in: high G+C Gram-positive bacteria) TaxID=2689056 RepID=UPI003ACF18C0
MLTWLGIKNNTQEQPARQFFGRSKKKTVTLTLIGALCLLWGVPVVVKALLPEKWGNDPVGAVIPGLIGILVAVLMVMVVERLDWDKQSPR